MKKTPVHSFSKHTQLDINDHSKLAVRPVWVLSALTLAIGLSMQASAAENEQKDEQTVISSQTSDNNLQLEEVVVTARRRVESEQKVPAPITVLKGKQLEEAKIYQVQDLQQQLPNFTSQFIHARQSSVAVRGIGNNTANEGLEGSVGIYLDNVFLGRPGQAVFDLLDIEQIDLLRGPQGTLFGKNTTAGVLNITSKKPIFDREGNIEVSVGERGYRQIKGTFNEALSDTVALRVSGYGTHDDGWVKNTLTGEDLNEINRYGVRGQILYKPSDDFNARIILEHNREDSSTGSLIPYSFGPWNPNINAPIGNLPLGVAGSNATTYGQHAKNLGANNILRNPYDYKVDFDGEQQAKVDQSAFSAELNWDLNGYKLTSITAWRDWNFDPLNDLDFSNLDGLTGGFKVNQDQFSQEIRLASPTSEKFDYVVGGYYFYQDLESHNAYYTGDLASYLTTTYPNNATMSGLGQSTTNSIGLFGQSTWHVNSNFDLTTGLRFTSERKTGQIDQNEVVPSIYAPFSPFFQAYNSGELKRTDDNIAGLITASYQFNPQILGFATFSTGEKSGGFNVNSVASPASILGKDGVNIEPETAKNYELGLKTTWLDNRIIANINLFLTQIDNYQAVTNESYYNQYIPLLTNVGDLTSKGVEIDFKAQLNRQFSANFNAAYTDATFDNGSAPTPFEVFNGVGGTADSGYGKGYRDISGNKVNGAPEWTANLTLQHQHDVLANAKHYTLVNYGWRSETYGDINNSVHSKIPSYGVLNLSTGLRIPYKDAQIDVSLWAKNALNKHYFLGLANAANNTYAGSAAQPRTVGASLKYSF